MANDIERASDLTGVMAVLLDGDAVGVCQTVRLDVLLQARRERRTVFEVLQERQRADWVGIRLAMYRGWIGEALAGFEVPQ